MATHRIHPNQNTFYFITFTCYKWLPLIEKTNLYDYLIRWTEQLNKRGVIISGYVIMPNHIHLLVFNSEKSKGLNIVMGEAKRFLAYEIIKRLKKLNAGDTIETLKLGVQTKERLKGKKHQVFRLSFDAKEVKKR